MLRVAFCLLISLHTFGQVSQNTTLLDHWSEDSLVTNSFGVRYNECFGFTRNGNEYAVIGTTEGSHFFQLSNDNKLVSVGFIEGGYNNSLAIHRDFAIYQNYIYSVCDEGTSSLQIVDVSALPSSISLVAENDTTFARLHNIYIDTSNALLYACTITALSGGILQSTNSMQVYSLADPVNPTLLYTGPNDIPEVHDIYVRDNIAYLNCGFDGLRVYDFSDPINPVFIQNINFYQDQGYNHQGALSPSGGYYLFADETAGKQMKFCSVINNQVSIMGSFGTNYENNSVAHNISITGHYAYVAYYNEGLRIYDLRGNLPVEVAHYDTYPIDETIFMMRGAWGVASNYSSGRVVVSDRVYGLFLIDFRSELVSPISTNQVVIFPNPTLSGTTLQIALTDKSISAFSIFVYDEKGGLVLTKDITGQTYAEIKHELANGAYHLKIQYTDYLGEQQFLFEKFIVD